MKKIIITAIAFIALVSCSDDLSQIPISDASTANFYRNETDLEQAVNGIYNAVAGPENDFGYPDLSLYLSEVRSDVLYGVGQAGVRDWEPVNNFSTALAGNPYIEFAWQNNYLAIFRANTVLDNLNEDNVPDAARRNQFEGEAKFLRAFCYFDLLRYFGRVPLINEVIPPADVLNIERSPVAEVYTQIIGDLQDAITLLPGQYTGSDLGRATAHAARGILARVYLTRSGPTYGIDGPGLDAGEYAQALTLLNEIIANTDGIGWVNDYASIFAYDNENNAEVIFDIQYEQGQLGTGANYPSNWAPQNYFAFIGLPFASGLEIIPVANDLLDAYEDTDVRKPVNFQIGYETVGGMETRAFVRKWVKDDGHGGDRFDWPINYIDLRYTDVLMMKAECILQGAGGTQQEVDDVVNDVRARAGLDPVSNVTLDMLLDERRREFAGECLRWHDLVRTGKVLEVMAAWIPVEDVNEQMSIPTADMILYPVPQSQIDVKKGLYDQNNGY